MISRASPIPTTMITSEVRTWPMLNVRSFVDPGHLRGLGDHFVNILSIWPFSIILFKLKEDGFFKGIYHIIENCLLLKAYYILNISSSCEFFWTNRLISPEANLKLGMVDTWHGLVLYTWSILNEFHISANSLSSSTLFMPDSKLGTNSKRSLAMSGRFSKLFKYAFT